MKVFMEGRGFLNRTFYKQPFRDFIGACVFITSNGLPNLSRDDERKVEWEAIKARTSFIKMEGSFGDHGPNGFPFNEIHLAHYLNYLMVTYDD